MADTRARPRPDSEWTPDLDPDDLRELQAAQQNPTKIIARLPKESSRLGCYSTLCLIANRLIGSGVFNSAGIVFPNTQSIGLSLLLWVFGALFALSGVVVYIELGLTIPRWPFGPDGEKISTPRSGDALNYFNYMLKRPMFFATCLFGIAFIILENSAHNSIAFASNVLAASNSVQTPGKVVAIAITVNTFCCLLHAISRRWGIIINNVFGTFKFLVLVFIVIIGFIYINSDVAKVNFDPSTSFSTTNMPKLPYRYAEAFMFVIFPYGAFHQVNYVISELENPRKTFPRASFYGNLIIAIMFTAVNFIYAALIPKHELFTRGLDIGARYFQLTLGRTGMTDKQLGTFWPALKAISALGNLIVTTFTAARVKQEIAKEGILPYSLFFAKSYDFSLARLFGRKKSKPEVDTLYSENTPVATLALHWTFTNLMAIIPTLAIQPTPYVSTPAYTTLVGTVVYVTNLIKFTLIAFGFLCLRFTPSVRWAEKSQFNYPALSIISALFLLVACLFPLIFLWVPDPVHEVLSNTGGHVSWFVSQTFGIGIMTVAFLYWVLFRSYLLVRSAREGKTLVVKREPKFKMDSGGLTQIVEIVSLQWVREVGLRLDEIDETSRQRRWWTYPNSQPNSSSHNTYELSGQSQPVELGYSKPVQYRVVSQMSHHELE